MITHKFSFSGSDGKVNRIDAARNYSTPLTTPVYKDYSIDIDLSGYGQLAAVSLDGRLWLFQDGNSLDFVALRWDDSEGKMTFAENRHFDGSGDVVLARGLDWILTSKNIFLVTDSAPYVRQAALFDENIPGTFLYSALRNSNVPLSGTDPFTKQAWGRRDDNGNYAGNARFSKDTHLLYPAGAHTFEQCYSLLPAVGDWIIFENFLIRRPDNPISQHFNYMLNVRPLLPLELLEGTAAFGTGYNFDHRGIQLAYLDGKLWGRGLYHIGRVLILPAGFDQHGEPQEFYLYISNDFKAPDNPSGFHLSKAADFNYFEEHTFALFSDCTAWDYAEALCRLMGGHLASSTSTQKNSFLSSMGFSGWVCIGGIMDHFSYEWQWVTGEPWDFDNWRTISYNLSDGERLCLNSNGLWDRCINSRKDITGYICEWDYILSQQEQDAVYHRWLNVALASISQDNPYGFVSSEPMPITGGACIAADNSDVLELQDANNSVWHSLSQDNAKLFFDYFNQNSLLLEQKGAQVFNNGITPASDYKCPTLRQWLAPADNVEAVCETGVIASADNSAFFTNFQRGFHREVFSPCSMPLTAAGYNDDKGNSCRLSACANSEGIGFKHSLSNKASSASLSWEDIYREHLKINLAHSFDKGSYPWQDTSGDFNVSFSACVLKSDLFEQYSLLDAVFSDYGITFSEDIPSDDLEAHKARLFQWPYLLGKYQCFLPVYVTGSNAHFSHFFVCEVYYEKEEITRIQFFSEKPQDFDNSDKYRSCWETDFLQSIDIELSYFDFAAGSWKSLHLVCPCDFSITQDYQTGYPAWWSGLYSYALVAIYEPLSYWSPCLLLLNEQGFFVPMISYSLEFREADRDYASYTGNASLSFKRIGSLPTGLQNYANTGECFSAIEYRPAEIVLDGNGWYRWTGTQTRERTYPSGRTYTEEISYYPDIEKRKLLLFPSVEIVTPTGSGDGGYSTISSLTFRVIENGILASLSLPAAVRFAFVYQRFYTYIDHNNFYVDAQGFKRSKTNFHFLYHYDGLLVLRSDYDPDALTLNVTEADSAP